MGSPPVLPGPPSNTAWGPPPHQPSAHPLRARAPRRAAWPLILGGSVLVIIAVVSTAVVTYAITRPEQAEPVTSGPTEPQYSALEQSAAKDRVCTLFDLSLRGQEGQGGLINNGEVNVPVMVRRINSVVAVLNALNPATPADIKEAAQRYIDTSLQLTSAAAGKISIDEGNRLNDLANQAIFAFADACGVPR